MSAVVSGTVGSISLCSERRLGVSVDEKGTSGTGLASLCNNVE